MKLMTDEMSWGLKKIGIFLKDFFLVIFLKK